MIVTPLAKHLQDDCHQNIEQIRQHLQAILSALHGAPPLINSYAAENVFSLCLHLDIDPTGLDFSHLTIRQADLHGANLPEVEIQSAHFAQTVFTQTSESEVPLKLSLSRSQRIETGAESVEKG